MKRCPTCQRRYADDTLNFCLEDGTQLDTVNSSTDETLTLDAGEPPPTEILDPALAPTIKGHARPAATARQEARATRREEAHNFAAVPAQGPARSTTSVVAVTVVATILLLGLGGLGAWLLLRDTGTEVSRDGNRNVSPTPEYSPNPSPTSTSKPSPSPTSSTTPTPTPRPTETPGGGTASREVANALEGWRRTMSTPSVAEHMDYYANTLHTYYNASNVDVQMVRNNVARAFSTYDSRDVRISNLQIDVDASGERAVATFDKTFEFRGAGGKTYAASGLNRFWFEKIGGRWLITGEKDLKVYYVNK